MPILTNSQLNSFCNYLTSSQPQFDTAVKRAVEVLYLTGCRGNELFMPLNWALPSSTDLTLQPQKGNNLRHFDPTIFNPAFIANIGRTDYLIPYLSFNILSYYLGKELHRWALFIGNKPVNTHLFRYNYARSLYDSGLTIAQIAVAMGEVSTVNVSGYLFHDIYYFQLPI